MSYLIRRIEIAPALDAAWESEEWAAAETLQVALFRPESSDHHPRVKCRLLYDETGLFGMFRVEDRYVLSAAEKFQDPVCQDSCVEFFAEPLRDGGYFNFEMNCGGTLLVSHILDARRTKTGFAEWRPLTMTEAAPIRVVSTLPRINLPERTEPVVWRVGFFIPFEVFGPSGWKGVPASGTIWRANFYKCADASSHPHWASWQPVPVLNFHLPEYFGEIVFA